MKEIKPLALSLLIIAVVVSGAFIVWVSYHSMLVNRLSETVQLRNKTYPKSVELKMYSDDGVLLFKRGFKWAGAVKDSVMTDSLLHALSFLSKNTIQQDIVPHFFSKVYQVDRSFFQDRIVGRYAKQMILTDNQTSTEDASLIYCYAVKKLMTVYNEKTVYMDFINSYSFGKNVVGVNGAAEYVFGKKFKNLKLKEQLVIFSMTIYHVKPGTLLTAEQYRNIDNVLWNLYENDFISHDVMNENLSMELVFRTPDDIDLDQNITRALLSEMRRREIDYKSHSYTLYSSIHMKTQQRIRRILKKETTKKDKELEAAFVLVDFKTAQVRSMVGGVDHTDMKDRSRNVKRQVGSVFKPIVYLTAFNKGVKPNSIINDKPYTFKKNGMVYRPKNYEDFFMGKTRVANGLIHSLNNATVKLATKIGLSKVSQMAVDMGFKGARPFLAMPLGSIPFSPFEVAAGYTVFGNYGVKKDVSLIDRIIDPETGKNVLKHNDPIRVASDKAAKNVVKLMRKVVSSGTARGARLLRGTAGKTGTTNNYKDAWFASIFPPYVGICWVGFDDYRTMGDKGTGGQMAAPIVAKIQKSLLGRKTKIKFDLLNRKRYKKHASVKKKQ